ncbi:MAG: Gfo/Idh/MocA family oxidoreductase [Gemmatimonadales bacterium]|nr:Gfo/Idh/MocA family oxidoreductase [Gemmatimonadales bacterium]NIN12244.1 Gfo/Idh/MocA family oxidoreductase [Gemmatimonadales bacterium]NIQ99367.1 Gfo/Idh/MocA family oxidoreductase [Gemmatimonadales bacterium]NIS64048.1 Gfo/Idh/MocA family oxidoreductase [Gemmatimonadales bacterium]
MSVNIARRTFMSDMAAAAAAFHIVPRYVLGGPGFRAPSDKLNVACIGVGGMGHSDVRGVSGENVYALCDVDDRRAARSFDEHPRAKRYKDFRVMLERDGDNIDAVTVSTPDHTHAVAAMMALKMGKHVYCQKPLTRTIWESQQLAGAARDARVSTQMGNQGHSWEGTRQIREWVEAGWIGTVREVQYWTNRPIWPQAIDRPLEAHHVPQRLDWDLWLGPAPPRPYHPAYVPFSWRGWWDFGTGALGDIACHSMDAAFWALDLGYPSRIEPESTTLFEETAPAASRITYHFPARGNRVPVTVVWRDGNLTPPRPKDLADGRSWPWGDSGQLWVGDEGTLVAGIYGDDPRLVNAQRQAELMADPPEERYPRTEGVYAEWIDACKSGGTGGSDFAAHAGPLTEMVLLGNLAVRTAKVLELDPQTGRITNTTIPEEYMKPELREGWSL